MHQLRKSLTQIVDSILSKDDQKMVALFLHWSEIIGHSLAQQTQPCRWIQDKHGYRLWLKVPSGCAMDVQYHMPVMTERLNQYLGHKIKITLEPSHHAQKAIQPRSALLTLNPKTSKSIQAIQDPHLRHAYAHWYNLLTQP